VFFFFFFNAPNIFDALRLIQARTAGLCQAKQGTHPTSNLTFAFHRKYVRDSLYVIFGFDDAYSININKPTSKTKKAGAIKESCSYPSGIDIYLALR